MSKMKAIEEAAKDLVKEPVELIERILYVQMKSILEEMYDQMHKARQSKLDKIQEWYETADRSAESWARLSEIMENQGD